MPQQINVIVIFEFFKTKNNSKIHNFVTMSQNATKQSLCTPPHLGLSHDTKNVTKGHMVQEISK